MHRRLRPPQQVFSQVALALLAAFVLIPLWSVVYLAFDSGVKSWPLEFRLLPKEASALVFLRVWARPAQTLSFLGLLRNSLIVSVGAALAAVGLGASMAYGFARFRFPGRKAGLFALLLGTLLPPVALMTPLYILLSAVGLRTSLLGLVIVYAAFSMPFCIWNMRSAFQAVPKELEESAFLDGASAVRTFFSITLPMALPAIGVAALIAFLIGYSEFAMGWLFVEKSQNVTLAMAISGMLQTGSFEWPSMAALAIMMSLPVIVLFILFQRLLLERWLIGAVE